LTLAGSSTPETLKGNRGNNLIDGDGGNDTLDSGNGNDTLTGGAGDDWIDGGGGSDTAVFSGSLSSYLTTYSPAISAFTISGASTGTDTVFGVEFFQFSDQVISASALQTYIDTVAPTILSLLPADNATGVAIDANLVLSFSEAIQRGTGSVVLKTAAGAIVASYDAATSANLSISGSTPDPQPQRQPGPRRRLLPGDRRAGRARPGGQRLCRAVRRQRVQLHHGAGPRHHGPDGELYR
jgi:hypothetical protein